MPSRIALRPIAAMTMIAVLGAVSVKAQADVFEVKGSDVTKGEREVSLNTATFMGFPVNSDRLRYSSELSFGYGFTEYFKASVKGTLDKPLDDDFRLSTAGVETQFMVRSAEKGLGIAWFTGVDFRVHDDETNTVTFGPIIQLNREKTTVLLNPFFARTFGTSHGEGTDFSYAWAVKQELRDGVSIGLEGYGTIPNIGDAPGTDQQPHRIGPVVYLERGLGGRGGGLSIKDTKGGGEAGGGNEPKLSIEAGVLFGLTDATQDVAFRLKGSVTF